MRKWGHADFAQRSACQHHFLDLCELMDGRKPAEAGATGEWFNFDRSAAPQTSNRGGANAWNKGFLAWECKGTHEHLEAAAGIPERSVGP